MEIMQRYSNRSIDDEIYSCMIDDVKALILKHKDTDDEQRANETKDHAMHDNQTDQSAQG